MKVTGVEIWEQPLELREPLVYAHHTVSSVSNVGLRLHMNDGLFGLGFAAPETEVTGETVESVLQIARDSFEPLLTNEPVPHLADITARVHDIAQSAPAARAMLDMALHDYYAKKEKKPLWKLLGATRSSLPTSVTIYIHTVEETVKRAEKMLNEGFSILKVKGGIDIELDIARVNALGERFPKIPIIWDVNQGYTASDVELFCAQCLHPNVLALEQPFRKHQSQGLSALLSKTSIPIMADESLCTREDAKQLIGAGVAYFNIKLMKTGSIRSCIEIAQIGARKGVRSMYSCMDECAYVNAAGLHSALASQGVDFVDLDSFTDYRSDPTRGSIQVVAGCISTCAAEGIGIFEG